MGKDKEPFDIVDELKTELEYWQHRAFEAERLRDLDREYINDLYAMRDAGI
jgi:hypothetical protein